MIAEQENERGNEKELTDCKPSWESKIVKVRPASRIHMCTSFAKFGQFLATMFSNTFSDTPSFSSLSRTPLVTEMLRFSCYSPQVSEVLFIS